MRPKMNFIKSMDDMELTNKSISSQISEDRETRQKRREERRQERQEKKFGDSSTGGDYETSSDTGKFKLPSFLKALEGIKNQIIAQLVDTDTALKNSQLGGKNAAKKYKAKFLDLLDRAAKIIAEASYRMEKDGKKLEDDDPNDRILIKGYRENYTSLKNDFEKSLNSYSEEINKEKTEYLKDLKYKEIVNPIEEARSLFATAFENLSSLLKKYVSVNVPAGSTTNATKPGENATASSIKIESPVKKGVGSKAKPDETVKKVQELILSKFKNKEVVTKTQQWKTFSKYGADGSFGNGTGNLIILLKGGFGMEDKTSDITQSFIDELNSIKESNKFLSYDEFLKMNEAWSDEAFTKALEKTPQAKTTIKSDTTKKEEVKADTKEEKTDTKEEKKEEPKETVDPKEVEGLLIKASEAIVSLFKDASFWDEFKGTISDDEEAAAKEFSNWYTTTLGSKYLKPAKQKVAKVENSDDKQTLEKNIKTLTDAGPKLIRKISGEQTDDNFYWKMYLLDGSVKSYKVDTDF